jgi:two-component system, LuxR family, sensor kinase FixL
MEESSEGSLRPARDELEQQVAQRTAVLKALNCELQQQIAQCAKAEEALQQEKERYRRLVETIPHGILELDTNGIITFCSAAHQGISGLPASDLVGTHFSQWIRPESETPQIQKAFGGLLAGQPTRNAWVLHLQHTSNGKPLDIRVDWNYKRDEAGEITGFVLVVTDITEQCRADEKAQRQLGALAHVARLSTMGEMVSGLAHEMNQPLTVITNYAQICRHQLQTMQGSGRDEMCSAVVQIEEQAARAAAIIRHLRDFVRPTLSRHAPENVNELVRNLVVLLEVEARLHDVSLELLLHASLPAVLVDRIQIEQVLVNLVKNAMEAMPQKAEAPRTVTIETSLAAGDATRDAAGDMVQLSVIDTGEGFARADAERLFEPFYTTKAEGIGLGLSISRSIVEAHGGQIWAEPNADRGSRFCFCLPVSTSDLKTTTPGT